MSKTARPVEGEPDQEQQAQLIRPTGNGPTVDDEQQLLAARFGDPDMSGVYRGSDAPADDDQDDEQQPVDAQPATAPAAEGGETA
ncbi:hypothetical protein [Streptomyces chryseus]|uniref:hypothetical protein n=1 Tax=Streptomyces chryseus TaxID=68186 RepID=UPI00110FF7BD|nr:hypothetical protein [Streptomyces chryseus]GGX01841.1 hypothetical protein GCM10010353_16810 [Streptomyces chryseus]